MNSKSKKGLKILGGSLLTLAILALLSITYATYTQTLNITGAGTVKKAKWEIKFKGDKQGSDVTVKKHSSEGSYEEDVEQGSVSVDNTTLSISNASLKRPGDYITYEFEVDNTGDFDAILNAANIVLECKQEGINQTEKTNECKNHIKVSLLDNTGSELADSDDTTNYNKSDDQEHKLTHKTGNTEKFTLKIEYKTDNSNNGTGLLTEDVQITNFGATLTYIQYNASAS